MTQLGTGRIDPSSALEIRGVDFSYGRVQVLFDVDLDVAEGEIVALLGTNGAGKSTLLHAAAGLRFPDRGLVRVFGRDVTRMRAEQKVRDGVVMVPGGRATFPSLTVAENLRTAAYTFRSSRRRVAEALDTAFEAFPVLAERASQRAGTLSGGEQQMLALARAHVLRPRLLMIDELTLGLAPIIAQRLVDGLRALTDEGTSVLLVEQSVTLALSVASTAYFMERGRILFGGPAPDLMDRTDLLRSVFLEGAGARS